MRRGSLDGHSSPVNNAYFPHDLDDIYEYKTDHQYFTHLGTYQNDCLDKFAITSEAQRNSLFRNHHVDELNDYRSPKSRFDNTSFIRSLNSSISQSSVDSGNNTGGSTTTSSNNSKEKLTAKGHHHNSIQEIIKSIGKKVHIWPRNRHDSINENENQKDHQMSAREHHQENFRSRSKSLDVTMSRRILNDCESTYKIYDRILKEGKYLASKWLTERTFHVIQQKRCISSANMFSSWKNREREKRSHIRCFCSPYLLNDSKTSASMVILYIFINRSNCDVENHVSEFVSASKLAGRKQTDLKF